MAPRVQKVMTELSKVITMADAAGDQDMSVILNTIFIAHRTNNLRTLGLVCKAFGLLLREEILTLRNQDAASDPTRLVRRVEGEEP